MIPYFKELQCYSRLKYSPLFNLSLSSKELFHSNFLAWIFENYREETVAFFNEKIESFQLIELLEVEREKNHIDITLTFNDSYKVLIENKVKSLPRQDQLDEYNSTLNKGKEVLFLLSLFPFNYQYFISYQEISDWLQSINIPIELDCKYEDQIKKYYIIKDYIGVAKDLTELVKFLSEEDIIFNFHSRSFLYAAFNELRLHDIFHKIKYSRLKDRISAKVLDWLEEESLPKDLFVANDYFSRGSAAANLTIPINTDDKRMYFEIQLQDNILRFILFSRGCVKNQNIILNNSLFHDFFNLSGIESYSIFEKAKMRNDFNKYGDYIIYNYVIVVDGCNIEALIDAIVEFTKKAILNVKENKMAMREFLENLS